MKNIEFKNYNKWCENIYNDITNNNKKIILIAGASGSGKSYSSKFLCKYLKHKGLNAISFSADNYYKGISKIIVEKALLNNEQFKCFEKNKNLIISKVKSVIENSPFTEKFSDQNKEKLLKELCVFENKKAKLIVDVLEKEFKLINFDEPFAVNLDKLVLDIKNLINKKEILLPFYSFASGEQETNKSLKISADYDVYIIEGLYVLRDEVLNILNINEICTGLINSDIKTLLSRRFNRDIKSGRTTYSPEQTIMTTLTKTMPSYMVNILPYNKNAKHILNTNLTNEEINSKEKSEQIKFKLTNAQLEALKKLKLQPINKTYQEDYYFEDHKCDNNFILRLRIENGIATKISFKNNLNNSRMIEEYNISDFSEENKQPANIINKFLNIGLNIKTQINKQRLEFNYNDEIFKLDIFNNKNYIEIDNKKNNSKIVNILELKNGTNLPYVNIFENSNSSYKEKENQDSKNNKKHIEKEYKFIVDKIPKNHEKILKINQFYFNFDKKNEFLINFLKVDLLNVSSARVRIVKENNKIKYYLTLKSGGNFEREEQEIEISKEQAIYLLKDNIISKISKNRYILNINNILIEFDEYPNNLKVAEVEVDDNISYNNILNSLNELHIKYVDVTNNPKFKNENLAK